MKKILSVFISCLSFFVFFISFTSFSEKEQNSLLDLHIYQANAQHANYYLVVFENDNTESTIKEIENFVKYKDYSVFLGHSINHGSKRIGKKFVYLPKGEKLPIFTKQGKMIDYSTSSPFYLSSEISDKDAFDIIDLIDKRNNASYKDITQIYTLDKYVELGDKRTKIYANFVTKDNEEQFRKAIYSSSLSKSIIEVSKRDFEIKYAKTNTISYSVLITSAITIFVLLAYYMLKQDKEIAIRKLMGQSSCCICKKIFLKQTLYYFLMYLFIQILCFIYFVNKPRPVTYPLLLDLILYAFAFMLFLVVCYGIMYIFIKNRRKFYSLKKEIVKKPVIILNLLLKFAVLMLIAQPFVLFFKAGIPEISEFTFLHTHSKELKNKLYLSGIYENSTLKEEDLFFTLNEYMEMHGGLYQNFETYEAYKYMSQIDADFQTTIYPFIYVNENYLKKYPLYDVDGNPIHLENYQQETLFVPDIYPEIQTENKMFYCSENPQCEVVSIKGGTKFYNMHFNSSIHSLKDPLIVFKPEAYKNPDVNMNGYYLPVNKKSDEAEFKAVLKEKGLDSLVTLQNTNNDYQIAYEKGKDEVITFLLLLITYIIVILSFIYQNTYIYFLENKQKFALEYLYGNTFLQRHGNLFLNNLIVYAPLMLCLYFVFGLKISEVVVFIILAVLFEILASWILIRFFEKKRLVAILKGE